MKPVPTDASGHTLDSSYVFELSFNDQHQEYVTNKLIQFNRSQPKSSIPELAQTPLQSPSPLHVFALNGEGIVVGGLVGRTHSIRAWLEVSILWVDETERGQGLGRRLMLLAEEEAVRRGCRFARLSTSDFQAPGFYEKVGYTLYGTLEDCPPGETVFYFRKNLEESTFSLSHRRKRAKAQTGASGPQTGV